MAARSHKVEEWAAELEALCERIAPRFYRWRSAVGQEPSRVVCLPV